MCDRLSHRDEQLCKAISKCQKEAAEEMVGKPETDLSMKKDKSVIIKDIRQSLQGHCHLNHHMAKLSDEVSGNCPNYGEEETVQHFIYECPAYKTERQFLENDIENILHRYNESGHNLDLATITGQIDGRKQLKKELLSSFKNYLLSSNIFQ